jgi:hypothetical protein
MASSAREGHVMDKLESWGVGGPASRKPNWLSFHSLGEKAEAESRLGAARQEEMAFRVGVIVATGLWQRKRMAPRLVSGRRVGLGRLTRRRPARTGCPKGPARRRMLERGFGGRHAPKMSPPQLKEVIQVAHTNVGRSRLKGALVGGEVYR